MHRKDDSLKKICLANGIMASFYDGLRGQTLLWGLSLITLYGLQVKKLITAMPSRNTPVRQTKRPELRVGRNKSYCLRFRATTLFASANLSIEVRHALIVLCRNSKMYLHGHIPKFQGSIHN